MIEINNCLFLGLYKETKKMRKVYEYYKDKIEQDIVPTMNEVDQELYLIETVKVMKQAEQILSDQTSDFIEIHDVKDCLMKLQEQIITAEETILQFKIDMEEMAKYYEKK